jgi:hypothetical protein
MARTTATVSFQAIELKGSLLPGSLLEQVARLNAPLQKEADYGLAKGERLRERIDAAWVRLKEIWAEYKDLRERTAQSVTGLHASARILREVLGWPDLQPCSGWQHGESQFPITHRAFEGAVPLIVRGIASDQLDKGSNQFGQEGRRRSPHSCLQECLNADDNANWGLLLTGDRLRLLHDNPSLVKPAYLAVDLELLVEGELFDEFAVLWLLLHASRFRHPQTGSCVLDTWKEQAQEAGERVLGQLRNGVQQALEALGNGLLQHPDNEALRHQLASGALSGQELHRQLLRLVYRFLFLFTAEDRDLLFPRTLGQEDPRRRIYREGYSIGRLRELAIRRSASEGAYGDLWQTQKLVFLQLRQSSSPLGLPGLGGLFAEPQCQALEPCELSNRFLLRAIRAIGWFQAGDTLTRVNYRDLNTEELGSVYEGLLELHPQLERAGGSWQLSYGGGAGSDRKTTGSYYTPDQLVQLLIVSALLPVIADRLSKATTQQEKEAALLAIRVLDPACGSGHFLLAAARRLALELARIRAGDEEPSEELRQECLREVAAHCIYGVDKNPMAVELCKVALWIEAVDPGKPLSFLDAHIQCGDSLVGVFDPKVLEQGIPDEAYKPLTGDDRTVCTSLKSENAAYRKASKGSSGGLQGSLNLSGAMPSSQSQNRLHEIEAMPEDSLAESSAKQEAYASWLQEAGSDPEQLAADLFTAAFFLPKTAENRACVPTTEHLLKLQLDKTLEDESLIQAASRASRDFRFFHWHLRFGEVMKENGFDCILGNPPYLFGEERPRIPDTFELKYRQWDLCWIFVERSEEVLRLGGAIGLVLPDSILLRSDPSIVREFILDKFDAIHAIKAGAAFEANVGVFCLSARKSKEACDQLLIGTLGAESTQAAQPRPSNGEKPWLVGAATPGSGATPESRLRIPKGEVLTVGDVASISRGEELGKSYLNRLRPGEDGSDERRSHVMAGEGIAEPFAQPNSTHWTLVENIRKKPEIYKSPKIVCLKTGRKIRAAIDSRDLVTLQSAYNIQVSPKGRTKGITPEFLCALLNSSRANAIYIESITGAKALFPQITQKMIKDIEFGLPEPSVMQAVSELASRARSDGWNPDVEGEIDRLLDPYL